MSRAHRRSLPLNGARPRSDRRIGFSSRIRASVNRSIERAFYSAASMAAPLDLEGPPSMLGPTIRRAIVLGRIYLVIGIGFALVLAITTTIASGLAFEGAVTVLLPVFAVRGAMGGIMVFTNDHLKGVFEYLIAYGVSPRRRFVNVLVTSLVLGAIVIGISLAVGVGLYLATGQMVFT